MKLFGLTGGIGCGKSTVLRMIAEQPGMAVIDNDIIMRKFLEETDPVKISEILEADVVTNGLLDRAKFLPALFADRDRKNRLERHLAPAGWKKTELAIATLTDAPCVVIESAILFEAELEAHFKAIVVVSCRPETQLLRLQHNRGFTEMEALTRIASLLPNAEKVRRSDFVIETDRDTNDVRKQVETVCQALMRL